MMICLKKQQIIFLISLSLFLTCCGGGYREGIIQEGQDSYLRFTGNLKNCMVFIDNFEPFEFNLKEQRKKDVYYQITPGKHKIIIKRKDLIVVDRVILTSRGITTEINIP